MSNVSQTKAAVNAARAVPTDDRIKEIADKTLDEFDLATDSLRALARLLCLAEADKEHHYMYSPGCIAVMVEAITEAVDNSVSPLRTLRADFYSTGGKRHE